MYTCLSRFWDRPIGRHRRRQILGIIQSRMASLGWSSRSSAERTSFPSIVTTTSCPHCSSLLFRESREGGFGCENAHRRSTGFGRVSPPIGPAPVLQEYGKGNDDAVADNKQYWGHGERPEPIGGGDAEKEVAQPDDGNSRCEDEPVLPLEGVSPGDVLIHRSVLFLDSGSLALAPSQIEQPGSPHFSAAQILDLGDAG